MNYLDIEENSYKPTEALKSRTSAKLMTGLGPVTSSLPISYNALSMLSLLYLILRETLYFGEVLLTTLRAFSLCVVTFLTRF